MDQFWAGVISGAVGTGLLMLVGIELRRWREIERRRRERCGYIEDWIYGRGLDEQRRRGARW